MSASPLFRQLTSSQPTSSAPAPKMPKVLNMSDVHLIKPSEKDSANKAQRKAQFLQAVQRLLAKSDRKNPGAAPSAVSSSFTQASQPVGHTNDFAPPAAPTPSVPRIGVVRLADLSRSRTPQACERCRERKTKCSGTRPTCKRCFHSGAECVYVLDHKANRAQFKKIRDASGLFPKGLRPTRKEGSTQRKISPSRIEFFKFLKSGSSGRLVPMDTPMAPQKMAVPKPSASSFEFLDVSPPKTRVKSSPLSSMSWTAPDESSFSQVPAQSQYGTSAMDNSYSLMNMDSDVDAAVAFMMANETLPEAQAQIHAQAQNMAMPYNQGAVPLTMPSLSATSQSTSGYSSLPTPIDEDVLMMDMFGPEATSNVTIPATDDITMELANLVADADESFLPASDSELERELQACMAEMLPPTKEDETVAFGLDLSRPVKALPARPRQVAAAAPAPVPPPVAPLPGRSFPEVSSEGMYFDQNMFNAFGMIVPIVPKVPEIKITEPEIAEVPAVAEASAVIGVNNWGWNANACLTADAEWNMAPNAEKEQSFDEYFGLKGGNFDELKPFSGKKLDAIAEEPLEAEVHQFAGFDPTTATLWEELFGTKEVNPEEV